MFLVLDTNLCSCTELTFLIQLFLIGDLEAQTDGEGQADEEAQTESGIEKLLNHLEVENNDDDDDDQVISPSISRNVSAKSRDVLKVDEKLSNDDNDDVVSPAISRNASAKSRSEVAIAQDEPLETDVNTETVDENDGDEEEKENNSDQIVQVDIDPVEQEALEDEILNEDEEKGEADNNDQPDAGSEPEKVGQSKSNVPFYLRIFSNKFKLKSFEKNDCNAIGDVCCRYEVN